MERDLVCGMEVDPKETQWKSEFNGKTYYFDSKGCKEDFDKEPQVYVSTQELGEEHMHHH